METTRELKLAIGLPLRNKEALTNLLRRLYDPGSRDYHHYLTPAQFADAFGPTEEDYQAVKAFAKAHRLKVTATHPNRTLLDVAGSVSDIEKTFRVTMRTYRHPKENRTFYAPDTEPTLELAVPILHIGGLDNYSQPHPMNLRNMPQSGASGFTAASGSGPGGAYIGNDFRAAYLPGVSLNGAGQTVGLVEFDGYYPSDISTYASLAGVPSVPLTNVFLDGFSGNPGHNNVEVSLDIDMAISMAPGLSSVIVYEGEFPDDILNRMATDGLASQFSASWTYSIDSLTEQIFQQFAAQGESFFNASGDSDAGIGKISTPSDDPNLTSVGGTTLTTSGPGGAWVSETVWNWDVEYGPSFNGEGDGGGISTVYSIPSWQLGLDMGANQGSTNFRNYPDVAMAADNVFVVSDNGLHQSVGGTSCAAPLWAGLIAVVNQQAAANGRPTVGFINPAIYALGENVNYTNAFHDITTGNNTWSESPSLFYAVPGYDLCTGWGTPAGSNLVALLALDSLQITPSGAWTPGGMLGGPLAPASQDYTLTNTGDAAFAWVAATTAPWLNLSLTEGTLIPGGPDTTIVASLNSSAAGLFLGDYAATIWFTNLTDGTVQSRAVSLAIIKPPEITAQPSSISVIEGTTVTFSTSAAGGLPLNCQWQHNGINMTDGGRVTGSKSILDELGAIYGSVISTLTISSVSPADAGTYAMVASNAAGVAIGSSAVLTIVPSEPVIIQQSPSQAVLLGATAQFVVAVEGSAPFTYQWQQNGTNLTDGGSISGSLNPSLTISGASSTNIGTYTVVVSNYIGTTTSTGSVLTVQVAEPAAQLVVNGDFETGAFPPWVESGNSFVASVSGDSTAVHSGNYGALLSTAGSWDYLSQWLPTQPGQFYLLSFFLNSTNATPASEFQVDWNGIAIFDRSSLPATGWTNLQFVVMAADTNTLLQLGFRDDQGSLGLDDIQVVPLLSADGPPIIATQPTNLVSLQGGAATLRVLSSGEYPLSYQWQFDGADIDGATNSTLTLVNLTNTEAGAYDVVITNLLGSTISSNAQLTVLTGVNELITFDDLPYRLVSVPPSYDNLMWSNFYYLNGVVSRLSGYTAGMISVPKVAYNANGAPASISASAPFALFSAYLTAAWDDNLKLEVQGFNGSTLAYDSTYTLSATTPSLIQFNYVDVTSVQFITSGGVQHPGYTGIGREFAMDNVSAYVVPTSPAYPPESVNVLYAFDGFDGGGPSSALVEADDGNLYGTTEYGGTNGYGTVFRMTTNGALTTLVSFDASAFYPVGALVQSIDGNFYGTTEYGGTNGSGAVFSMTPDGTVSILSSFNYNVTGGNPTAALVRGVDGSFYGTTKLGGAYGLGAVFNVTSNGTLTPLISFNTTNGAYPYDALIQGTDGNFYGTTLEGGFYDTGTVFQMTTNGALTTLVSLNGFNAFPTGGLLQGKDGTLYGTSEYGGATDFGSVFSVTTNGVFATLASFDFYVTGGYPCATLLEGADGNLYGTTSMGGSYGTTYYGGTYGGGTIFNVTTNGTLNPLFAFENTNGLETQAGLIQASDGSFYGTTPFGGVGFNGYFDSGDGVIFRLGETASMFAPPAIIAQPVSQIVPVNGESLFKVTAGGAAPLTYSWQRNGSPIAGATQSVYSTNQVQLADSGDQFTCVIRNAYGAVTSSSPALNIVPSSGSLFTFNGQNGGYPLAALTPGTDGNFYGTTEYGGTYGDGEVFEITTNGALSTLASFNYYVSGANPVAEVVRGSDGSYYGATSYGGAHDEGTVFGVTTNGVLTTLVSFNSTNGALPYTALVRGSDGGFYGTTLGGGTYGYGTAFKVTTSGALTTLVSFSYSNGAYPRGALALGSDGQFYGTTSVGGPNLYGTVFRLTTNGTLTTLVSFDFSDGGYPQCALVPGLDGQFYGTTTEGGLDNFGTVFSIATNGVLTTLMSFDGTNGAYPQGGLVQAPDGSFYGTTTEGGTNNYGTVFSVRADGTLTSLTSLDGVSGSYPSSRLIQGSDGYFYGTTAYGGMGFDGLFSSGNGTVFRLAGIVTPEPPLIVTQPASQTALVGGSAVFSVTAAGSAPLTYLWQRNGTNIAGATGSTYTAGDVQLPDSGSLFSCLVSNAYGSLPSSNAILTVVLGVPGLITFDSLTGTDLAVPANYYNLTWSNFYHLNGLAYGEPSGYTAGVVSSNNVAYNNNGGPAAIVSSLPFNLLSAYLTAAWNDNLQVEAQGYNGSALVYDNTYTLSPLSPAQITFNYMGVTSVQFITSGGVRHSAYAGSGSQLVMDNVAMVLPPAPAAPLPSPGSLPMSVLYAFDGFDGGHPSSALMQGLDGNYYGTTQYGGAYGYGTVFQMTPGGALFPFVSFDNVHGAYPQGGVVQGNDGNFYGTTSQGGAFNNGTVFSLSTNGMITTILSFDGSNGAYPYGALALGADGNFYGTTTEGGANGNGTVFSLSPGGALATLLSFNGSNGAYPYGGLAQGLDGNFYGTTEYGGTNSVGTVFGISTNGALSTLVSLNFDGTGGYPSASLVLGTDGFFYGTTQYGGTNGNGTVFRMASNGALTTLVSFNDFNGAEPYGALVQAADGFFYGTTQYGGANENGTVFAMATNGTLISLVSLQGANGLYPQAGLVQGSDGALYGTATYGGAGFNGASVSGDGVVFRLGLPSLTAPPFIVAQPVGQIVPVTGMPRFAVSAGGAAPLSYSWQRNGSPIAGATQSFYTTNAVQLADSGDQFNCVVRNAYGVAASASASLTIFKASGALFSFTGPDGGYPSAGLVQGADGNFYGTTQYGGSDGNGTVFRLTTNGIAATLISFNLIDGAQPGSTLLQGLDGNFYGTTENGGTYQLGTVFRMTTNGVLTTLVSFNGADGAQPYGALVQGLDGNFYGPTSQGGANNFGTIFSLTTNGALTTLVSFDGTNGAEPYGALVETTDGSFYGTTENGGTNNYGTIFSMATNGTLTTLFSFSNLNGAYPQCALVPGLDGQFYGTTTEGGLDNFGTVFSIATNGVLTTLMSFDGTNGAYPQGGLVQAPDGSFYGTTTEGGTYNYGAAFNLSTNGIATSQLSFDGVNGSYPGSALMQSADGYFYGTTAYGGPGFNGLYSSGNGTVFRLAGIVTPEAPLIVTQPASQIVHAGGTANFSVGTVSSVPLNYLWQRNGTNIVGATLSHYATNNVQPADSGAVFSCLVSNAYGSTLSSNATLTVGPGSLAQNGGFELGTFAGWTISGNFGDCSLGSTAPFVHSGAYGAELGSIGSLGYISQNLVTIAGERYEISFDLDCDGQIPNEFLVSWNGANLFDRQNIGNTGWTDLQLIATATDTNSTLTFGFRDDPSYFGLDDITVYAIGLAPPEFQSAIAANGMIIFTWSAKAGQTYQLQYTTNLTQGGWTALDDTVTATNSTAAISEPLGADSQLFYRVVIEP